MPWTFQWNSITSFAADLAAGTHSYWKADRSWNLKKSISSIVWKNVFFPNRPKVNFTDHLNQTEHYFESATVFTILRKSTYLHGRSKVWGRYFFFEEKNNNYSARNIKLLRMTVKTCIMLQKIYIFFINLSINQRIMKKNFHKISN